MFKPKPGYRLELHILKSHAASRLNRDGAGRPKTITIGGCRRLRISSQAEKFSLKHSDIFEQFLEEAIEKYGATGMLRTRHAADRIRELLHTKILQVGQEPTAFAKQIDQSLCSLGNLFHKNEKKGNEKDDTTQLIAFSQAEITAIANFIFKVDKQKKIVIKDCADTIKKVRKERDSVGPLSPELQLFGRFTTASNYLENIDTPLQVSHGFTVHETKIEQDYWTAVDDLNTHSDRQGSAHLDTRAFGAGVFYHYYCLDVPLLSRNIVHAFTQLPKEQVIKLTRDLIASFLYAALCRNPIGSQTGHANHDLPLCAYATFGSAFPYSAQAAFERPVQREQLGGYSEIARKCFMDWMEKRKKRYGIFCGYEQGMGLDILDADLQTFVESSVDESTPIIRNAIFDA